MNRRRDKDHGTRPRLLFVANTDKFFVSHRLVIALRAKEKGYDVHVCAIDTGFRKKIEQHGLPFYSLRGTVAGIHPIKEMATIHFLWKLYRRIKPDLVHHIAVKPVIYGGLASRVAKVKAVVNALSGLGYVFIDAGEPSFSRKFARFVIEKVVRSALGHKRSRLILQNRDDIEMFTANKWIERDRILWIKGSGVDPDEFSYRPEPDTDALTVMFASRLLWDKGVAEFVRACKNLKKEFGDGIRCVLVGGADSENPAAVPLQTIKVWVSEGDIEWWGEKEGMQDVLAQTNIVVLPSYREGLPKVLIEACAIGRAIVATDVPGCREVVSEGENGFLVPVRDASLLENRIRELLLDRSLRLEMAKNGRRRAESEFALERVLESHMDLYSNLLDDTSEVQSTSSK